jgi:hypothetical protein
MTTLRLVGETQWASRAVLMSYENNNFRGSEIGCVAPNRIASLTDCPNSPNITPLPSSTRPTILLLHVQSLPWYRYIEPRLLPVDITGRGSPEFVMRSISGLQDSLFVAEWDVIAWKARHDSTALPIALTFTLRNM